MWRVGDRVSRFQAEKWLPLGTEHSMCTLAVNGDIFIKVSCCAIWSGACDTIVYIGLQKERSAVST